MTTIDPRLITRFAGGINNQPESSLFANFAFPDYSQYHYLFEDFDAESTSAWGGGGSGSPSRNAAGVFDGGAMLMSTSAVGGNNCFINTLATGFKLIPGKKLYFSGKMNISSLGGLAAADPLVIFGLQVAVSGSTIDTPTDGLFFRKAAGGTSVVLVSRKSNVETVSAAFGTVVIDQTFECAFYYPGDGVTAFAGFTANVANSPPIPPYTTLTVTAFPTIALGPLVGIQSAGAASNMYCDQIFCVKER